MELSYSFEPFIQNAIDMAQKLIRNQMFLLAGSPHSVPELVVTFDMHGAGKTNFGGRYWF